MIEYLNIKGEKHPIRVSYLVLKNLKKETGKTLETIDNGDVELYEPILFYALQSGAAAENKQMPFTREQMPEILDECMFDFLELIPLFFPQNRGKKGTGDEEGK